MTLRTCIKRRYVPNLDKPTQIRLKDVGSEYEVHATQFLLQLLLTSGLQPALESFRIVKPLGIRDFCQMRR